MIAICIKRIWF